MAHNFSSVLENHNEDINICISKFDINIDNYSVFTPKELNIKGDDSNKVYIKGNKLPVGIEIIFTDKAKKCNVFIDENIKAKASKISLKNENNFLYLGRNCTLNNIGAVILGRNDFIIVGESVSVTGHNTWSTGFNSGKDNNGLIIGDHCLIASEIIIRPGDGHLVIDTNTGQQLNVSHKPIVIEPYCWIAQRAAILKNVRIGACSIISLGAVVTKSCNRFSLLSGVPAKAVPLGGKMWLRGPGKEAKAIQQYYKDKFSCPASNTELVIQKQEQSNLKGTISDSLMNWEFIRTTQIINRIVSVDNPDFGLAVKYYLDLGYLDAAFSLLDDFERKHGCCIKNYPGNHIENWSSVIYCSRLKDRVRINSKLNSTTPFFTQMLVCCVSNELDEVFVSLKKLWNHIISKDIDAESNMILSYAVLKLIDHCKLDDELGIKISLHLHSAKNINIYRRRHLLKELIVYFSSINNTSFFSLPKAFTNHLHKISNTLQSYSNREVGAKYLNKIFIENIRTNNDFSIKRYARCPKRTAICVSGMMKIDDSAMRSLYQKIAEPLNADIFLHTWDKIQVWSGEARKSGFWQRQFKLPDNKIPHPLRDIDKFKEKFPRTGNLLLSTITDDINVHFSATHPLIKMSVIENEDVALHNWLNNKSFMSRGNYNQFKMYYGIKRVFELLKEYEENNGFKYDVIIRTRPDMFITKEFDIERLNQAKENSIVVNCGSVGPNDGIFYALRQDYEKIVSIWDEMLQSESLSPFLNFEKYDSHVLLYAWLCHKNIEMINIDDIFYDLAIISTSAKIPGLRQALEEDLINFDKNLKEQKQYTDLFNFLLSRSK